MKALVYSKNIGNGKPSDFGKVKDVCPFCDYKDVENIIEQKGEVIWTENKYPVLNKTHQTLIIETGHHENHLGNYAPEYAQEMLKFAFHAWDEMKKSNEYNSVIFYKNHGPMSGGTLSHAHMQIIGLKENNAYEYIRTQHFVGVPIIREELVQVNYSTQPFCGLRETNIIVEKENLDEAFPRFTQIIQTVFQHHLDKLIYSFNLFFYDFEGKIIVKFVPRYPTPPYFVGFGIPQVLDETTLIEDAQELAGKLC